MSGLLDFINLKEQEFRPVELSPDDLVYLNGLNFRFSIAGTNLYLTNPCQWVGHFQLPSGRIVVIEPKIGTANVFRMLTYVFTEEHERYLRREPVSYAADKLLFEPLVGLFNELVSNRVRRGLVQDYVRRDENSASFRGALNATAHFQYNLGHENRIYCRFFEQTVDVEDNRLVKSTLNQLLHIGGWTNHTTHDLVANFHQFDSIGLERSPRQWGHRHYHRLNDDYRPIHALCRMFLEYSSISERVGVHQFKGFLLDMNLLFEEFVQQAFVRVVRHGTAWAAVQKHEPLSMNLAAPKVKPDVTIRERAKVLSIADAKYKKDAAGPRNPDIYQVITYGTVLKCSETFLLYPHSELDAEHDFQILNSPIVVRTRRVNIATPDCIRDTESTVRKIIADCQRHLGVSSAEAPHGAYQTKAISPTI